LDNEKPTKPKSDGSYNRNPNGNTAALKPGAKTVSDGRYWEIPRLWTGETCFILAGGPSLIGFDPEKIRGYGRIIVVNTSYQIYPDADVLYFADKKWWDLHRIEVKTTFLGKIITLEHPKLEGVHSLREDGQLGLSHRPGYVRHGSNSGYQAINVAYLHGIKLIILLGYDMRTYAGRTHWHGGYGDSAQVYGNRCQKMFLPTFDHLVKPLAEVGVEVVNCTPDSALKCWPLRPLKAVLAEIAARTPESYQARRLTANGGLYHF
jgi:hypothetical protein